MIDFLWQAHHRLIAATDTRRKRFIYPELQQPARLIGIVGPRGVGKTTLLLQYLKTHYYDQNAAFYFSADNTYFNENSLLHFIDQTLQTSTISTFFIDEIHKYPNWNQELKNLYDAFPKLKIIFSGSSSIDLITGTYDLSRRVHLIHLPGLSFREYLNFTLNKDYPSVTFETLLTDHQKIAAELTHSTTILRHFEDYLLFGYYPTVLDSGRELLYASLANIIEKAIYEDIAQFYNLKTGYLSHFKRILNFLASIPPGQAKTNTFASRLGIDNKTVDHYLEILAKTNLIKKLDPETHGTQALSKPAKLYLDNTTLLAALNMLLASTLDKGTLRELAFLQFTQGANLTAYYPKQGDFSIHDTLFEIGGKNKTGQQLKNSKAPKFIVKDDLLVGYGNVIPLYLFGFLY